MKFTKAKISSILRSRGYRITHQRRAVLKTILDCRTHLNTENIYRMAKNEYPSIGFSTVYRTLNILSELGLICEVRASGNSRRYVIRRPVEHHHHLICSGCKKVVDFKNCDLLDIETRLAECTGFRIEDHFLEFVGICPDCQQTADS